MKTKVIAMYLPQYHEIEENSLFWGKGYTDWVGVKKAKPFLKDQIQPRVPLKNNYYDLSKVETLRWQVDIAKKHGIYGFGIYHYWFNNEKNLLTKPAENLLNNKDIDMPFFFAWDNCNWKRTWSKIPGNDWSPIEDANSKPKLDNGREILVEYILGSEPDWENHFNYLLPYFKDERYIKIDGKPLFFIFRYSKEILTMIDYWDELAKKHGFNGVFVSLFHCGRTHMNHRAKSLFNYEPGYQLSGLRTSIGFVWNKLLHREKKIVSYDSIWKGIIKSAKHQRKKIISGGVVAYDDTPRRGEKAKVLLNSSPEKFEKYFA